MHPTTKVEWKCVCNGLLQAALIWSAQISLYILIGGYLWYFKFTHSSRDTKQDIYLKDVILELSWRTRKYWEKNAYKNTSYTVQGQTSSSPINVVIMPIWRFSEFCESYFTDRQILANKKPVKLSNKPLNWLAWDKCIAILNTNFWILIKGGINAIWFAMSLNPYAAAGLFCPIQNDAKYLKKYWKPGTWLERTQRELSNEYPHDMVKIFI